MKGVRRVHLEMEKQSNSNEEISPMEAVMIIALRFLENSYGVLGSREFRIEDIRYYRRSNAWKVFLIRNIDGQSRRYEITIDLPHGRPVRFRAL